MTIDKKSQMQEAAIEYRNELLLEIQNQFMLYGSTGEESFTSLATGMLEDAELIDDYNPAFFDNGLPGQKHCHINGYSFSEVDGFLNLFVTKYGGDETPEKMGIRDVRPDVEAAIKFIVDRKRIQANAPDVADYVDCIALMENHMGDEEKSIRKFRIFLLTDGILTDNVRKDTFPDVDGKPVELFAYDIISLYESIAGAGTGTVQIDFEKFKPLAIHCVPAGKSGGTNNFYYESYMGVVPGIVLADIYDEFGARLLEGNVRSFLSTKGAVNKKIRETILRAPEQFFAFNNGISVTASNVRFDHSGNLAYAEEFQIINGGQTTASLSKARFADKADLSQINVLMKLTVTKEEMEADTKQDLLATISKASNQQNKVSDADFFSTHPFHVKMEKLSRDTRAPSTAPGQLSTYWFYERARGQYEQMQMKMTKVQRANFKQEYPPKQKITKTDLAKYRFSWEGKPYLVSKGAQSNFQAFAQEISELWDKGVSSQDKLCNPQYFKDSVALAIMFNQVGDIVSVQPWFTHSFRANIVTYSIAMLRKFISEQFPDYTLNLDLIWRNQQLPDLLTKIFVSLTKLVYDEITNERSGVLNYTQRCKQKNFWESMPSYVKLNLASFGNVVSLLVSLEEKKRSDQKGKTIGTLLRGVELQTFIIEKGPAFWAEISQFATEHRPVGLSPREQSALTTAIRGKLPPDFACKALQDLYRRCQENGFKG